MVFAWWSLCFFHCRCVSTKSTCQCCSTRIRRLLGVRSCKSTLCLCWWWRRQYHRGICSFLIKNFYPSVGFYVINVHVIQLSRNLMDPTENNNAILIGNRGVPTPSNWNWEIIVNSYLCPLLWIKIEAPKVIELYIVFALASENVHVSPMKCSTMASSWFRFWSHRWDCLPLPSREIISMYMVWTFTAHETAKCNHRLWSILDGSVFIQRHRNVVIILIKSSSLEMVPTHLFEIKHEDCGVVALAVCTADDEHFVVHHRSLMVGDRT